MEVMNYFALIIVYLCRIISVYPDKCCITTTSNLLLLSYIYKNMTDFIKSILFDPKTLKLLLTISVSAAINTALKYKELNERRRKILICQGFFYILYKWGLNDFGLDTCVKS